jgi:6-bladed beta-propeller
MFRCRCNHVHSPRLKPSRSRRVLGDGEGFETTRFWLLRPWQALKELRSATKTSYVTLVAGLLAIVSTVGVAQPSARSLGTPECPRCRIELDPVLTLRDNGGSAALLGVVGLYASDSKGRIFVANGLRPDLFVFDKEGQFVQRIGRPGAGPGEFQRISKILITSGDTLRVYDGANARETVFDPSLKVVRHRPLPARWLQMAVYPNDLIVANIVSSRPALAGLPLHLVSRSGEITKSFGIQAAIYRAGFDALLGRSLALGPTGEIFALRNKEYVLEVWDSAGRQIAELTRDVPWFKNNLYQRRKQGEPPESLNKDGLAVDSSGMLWALISVPDRRWKQALTKGGVDGETVKSQDLFRDTFVEVFDTRRRRLIASARIDIATFSMFGERLIASLGEDKSGEPTLRIWRLRLIYPST